MQAIVTDIWPFIMIICYSQHRDEVYCLPSSVKCLQIIIHCRLYSYFIFLITNTLQKTNVPAVPSIESCSISLEERETSIPYTTAAVVSVEMSIPANDDKSALFRGVMCLAPMVRAGSLPFRVLCMKYGADLVFGEEIIDKRLVKCKRVENKELNTIDFVTTDNNCTLFRTAALERNRVIFQMGTADAQTALQAARIIADDVAGIDINMGCPKVRMELCSHYYSAVYIKQYRMLY